MVLNVGAWGPAQWTLYAIGVGLLSGMLGNMWASTYLHWKEEKAKLENRTINWKNEFTNITIPIVVIIIIVFGVLILS